MLAIVKLGPAEGPAFRQLTFPRFRQLLLNSGPDQPIIAVGAYFFGQPAGLALAQYYPESGSANFLSVSVTPSHRGNGLGAALLESLEDLAARCGSRQAFLTYRTGPAGNPALERLLFKRGWSPPSVAWYYFLTSRKIAQAPWLQQTPPLLTGFSIFEWEGLTLVEKEQVERLIATDYRYSDAPFYQANLPYEPLNSLGLRYQGEIAGWILTSRFSPETIGYTGVFVRSDYRQMGLVPCLIAEATRRHLVVADQIPTGSWQISPANLNMLKFAEVFLKPYVSSIMEERESFKRLGGG